MRDVVCPICGEVHEAIKLSQGFALTSCAKLDDENRMHIAKLVFAPGGLLSSEPAARELILATLEEQQSKIDTLFEAIAHGDSEHRAWLKDAIDKHFERGIYAREPD